MKINRLLLKPNTPTIVEEEIIFPEAIDANHVKRIPSCKVKATLTDFDDVLLGLASKNNGTYDLNHSVFIFESELSKPYSADVVIAEFLGHEYYVHFPFGNGKIVAKVPVTKNLIKIGDKVDVMFNMDKAHLFEFDSKEAIF